MTRMRLYAAGVAVAVSLIGYAPVNAQARSQEPTFAFATDPIDSLLGFGHLREVMLPPSQEEVRIWVGFGLVVPETMLRLTTEGGRTRGQLYFFGESMDTFPTQLLVWLQGRALSHQCPSANAGTPFEDHRDSAVVERRGWVFACEVAPAGATPDWRELRARLVGLGLLTLPDPKTLSPEGVRVVDGISVQVEVRQGARYRTYTYENPGRQPWPEAARAQQILAAVEQLAGREGPY